MPLGPRNLSSKFTLDPMVMSPHSAVDGGGVRPLIRIPDPLRNWPWPRLVNPHYDECKRESDAWFQSFNAFSQKAQLAFVNCNFSTEDTNHTVPLAG